MTRRISLGSVFALDHHESGLAEIIYLEGDTQTVLASANCDSDADVKNFLKESGDLVNLLRVKRGY